MRHALIALGIILLPMILIILQQETGSALVYLSFFLVLYREGMPGSILLAGICAVVYFIVSIRFGEVPMPDEMTSWGEFSVFGLIILLSGILVSSYCKQPRVVQYILLIGGGATLLGILFSCYVIPFDVAYLQYGLCVALVVWLILLYLRERMSNYFYIVFNISKVGMVAGAMVKTGKVKRTDKARLIRDGIVVFTGNINALKRFKDDVKEVGTNFECGISLAGCNDLKVGDVIETYEEVEVKQTL
jgi:hypothetical protein